MQDRTGDFRAALDGVRSRGNIPLANRAGKRKKTRDADQFSVQFGDVSRRIHREIVETSEKLEKLQMLVGSSGGLYNDNPIEIQELTYIVKQDIGRLNRANRQLKELVELNGSNGNFNPHQQKHSSTIVVTLQNRLAKISESFKAALELRTSNIKKAKKRRDELAPGWSDPALAGYGLGAEDGGAGVLDSFMGNSESIDMSVGGNNNQQLAVMQSREDYITARADAMKAIESTIAEVGTIFQQLATMVHEQGEQVERIDEGVEDALGNVQQGHNELVKYFNSVSSNRTLMMKIFGVLLAFFIFFIVVLA